MSDRNRHTWPAIALAFVSMLLAPWAGAQWLVEPNDPLFNDNPGGVPRPADAHQWGSYALDLPQAWSYARGHAYIGVLDSGVDVKHEDLRAFDDSGDYIGGNLRQHLSWDYDFDNGWVAESDSTSSHGTHVSGIVAASPNNGLGVAGACWDCSLVMSQVRNQGNIGKALEGSIDRGMQVLNLSFGVVGQNPPTCPVGSPDIRCPILDALEYAEARDVVVVSAAGNDGGGVDFPAADPRVLGAGGVAPDGTLWDDCTPQNGSECGSNTHPTLLYAPAVDILSTFYETAPDYAPTIDCGDSIDGSDDGYGRCTGTSMAAPYLAASVGILRSVNPLMKVEDIRALLRDNRENPPGWNAAVGVGKPNIYQATLDALGQAGGQQLKNRLTPLFQLYGSQAQDYVYTTVPQMGAAMTDGSYYQNAGYYSTGTDVRGYPYFPGQSCYFSPCPPTTGASVFVFTTHRSPNGYPLAPLYRMSFEGTFPGGPSNPYNRDHTYAAEASGVEAFADVGYSLDGIEGYIYKRCSPEPSCMPPGSTRLMRYYNAARDDWALFPEGQKAMWEADGYAPPTFTSKHHLGYVYENVDFDSDWVINGFESLLGTNPFVADTDGDGINDGKEIIDYPLSDPLIAPSQAIGEFGQVTNLTHVSQTITFSRNYTNPVVIAKSPTTNGGQTSVVRITNVSSDRFTMFIHEAPDKDGAHVAETVSWVVLEAGRWRLPDGSPLEVGTVNTSARAGEFSTFRTVTFANPFTKPPIVLNQVQSNFDPAWVKTRAKLPSDFSFQLALETAEDVSAPHGSETIGWIALLPGSGVWNGHNYLAADTGTVVGSTFKRVNFNGFTETPKLLMTMASYESHDPAALRYRYADSNSFEVKVEEDTTQEPEIGHGAESVHWLALEGSGTLTASPW